MVELYKGEKAKIEDLKEGDVFQRIEEEPGEHKIPRVAIVQRNTNSYMDNRTLDVFSFFKGGAPKQLTIPGNVEVHRLTGKYAKDKKENYEKSKLTNLSQHIKRCVKSTGADPEMFVTTADGDLIPAFRFLPPKNKAVVTGKGETVYFDGYQAEFTTLAPACHQVLCDSIQRALSKLLYEARKKDPKAKLSIQSTFDVALEDLAKEPEEFVQFGCAPSFNVYDLNKPSLNGREVPFRMTGGHIHFGLDAANKTPEVIKRIVKAMDATFAVPLVSLLAEFDNPLRRTMYGQVGEYRTPPHGVEYRTPSNTYFMHPGITNVVLDMARIAAAVGSSGLLGYWKADEAETIQCVQNCDVALAREILKRNKDMFIAMALTAYPGQHAKAQRTYEVFLAGAQSVIKNPHDVIGNWRLTSDWGVHGSSPNCNWAKVSVASGKV